MKLVTLSMKNFMPYRGNQRVTFPTDPRQNVMVVLGDNMRGKTSLLNALRWGFYGEATGRHLKTIPTHLLHNADAANAKDWEFEVAIEFEADNHRYDLRRFASKKALVARPERAEDFDVDVRLQRDGTALQRAQIESEVNKFVPKQVSRFFLFDGELLQEYEALLVEGSEQGRRIKEAIEQVLGVPALIHGRDGAATLLKKAQKQQSTDAASLKGAERYVNEQRALQANQEALEKDLLENRARLHKTRDERERLDDDLERSDVVYQAKVKLDQCLSRRDEVLRQQEVWRVERLDLVSKAWRDLLWPKLRVKRESLLEAQRRLTGQIGLRSEIEAEVRQLSTVLETTDCPTCRQPVPEKKRADALARIAPLKARLESLPLDQTALTSVSGELSRLNKLETRGVGERLRDRDRELDRSEVEITRLLNEIEKLKQELQGYDTAEIARKRNQRDQMMRDEGKLEADVKATQLRYESVSKEVAIKAKQIESVPHARAKRSTSLVNLYAGVERAFKESVEQLRDRLRESVEAKASEAFLKMTTQHAYKGLQINKSYGLTIVDENNAPVSIRSAGAEQVVALSLIDGLGRTARSTGPVMMDTPFGRLDLKHRDNILRYLPLVANQLILLVHDGEIRSISDLPSITDRVGAVYQIREVGPRHSVVEKE